MRRRTSVPRVVSLVVVALVLAAGTRPSAQATAPPPNNAAPPSTPPSSAAPDLKAAVTLVGANATNDALTMPVRTGSAVPFKLLIKEPPKGHASGQLEAQPFATQEQPPLIAVAKVRTDKSPSADIAKVALDQGGEVPFWLEFDMLVPAKTYAGAIFVTADNLAPVRWNVTLTTAARGVLAVDPVAPLKFVRFPFGDTGSFSFMLTDKSRTGPYSNVRVRLESAAAPASKSLMSNFGLDTLSFWDKDAEADLKRRDPKTPGVTLTGAQTFTARVGPLSPGEYTGTLHFAADETADDAADAKLPVTIQVRHHWSIPMFVIVLASAAGWFTSKFIVGARKARALSRQTRELRERADDVARRCATSRAGWQFAGENVSLGFARVLVDLHRLARRTASTMEVIVRGDEIEKLQQRAELRLAGLESLQKVRLDVERIVDSRPAAQEAVGRLLRSATDILDRVTFAEADQATLTKVLDDTKAWAAASTFVGVYQQAVLARRRSTACPSPNDITGIAAGRLRAQLDALLKELPSEAVISGQSVPDDLKASDVSIARLVLLWRERDQPWRDDLLTAYEANMLLTDLFRVADTFMWKALGAAADKKEFELVVNAGSVDKPLTYDVVEVRLVSHAQDLDERRILFHPLRVAWRVQPPAGDGRTIETDGLGAVQYFPSPGRVEVVAVLRWSGTPEITAATRTFDVAENPEYRKRRLFDAGWMEYAAIGLAALFAIVTALAAQYDATFGSFTQYLALIIWGAGAGTGGNLFSQLGTTSTPGGAASKL